MFGIAAMIFGSIFRFKEDRKEYVYNSKERNNPNQYGTYYDYNGKERDTKTNKILHTEITRNRDVIQRDVDRNIVRNISEENRKAEFLQRKNDPTRTETVYVWNRYDSHTNDRNDLHKGYWHVDYKTGDIYVVRTITEYYKSYTCNINKRTLRCFVDINTGKAVRITDLEKKANIKRKEMGTSVMTDVEINDFIRRFNDGNGEFLVTRDSYYGDMGV